MEIKTPEDALTLPSGRVAADVGGFLVEVTIIGNTLLDAAKTLIEKNDNQGLNSQAEVVVRATNKYGQGGLKLLL